jgi:3-phenylpropionate/trans-cinnamate dioxygenase ferredoxin subunit
MTTNPLDSLTDSKPIAIEVAGKRVCVAKIGDEVFAVANTCSHAEADLSDGDINGFAIECWLHGAEFDLRDGTAISLPATMPLETYTVTTSGNNVTISEKKGK